MRQALPQGSGGSPGLPGPGLPRSGLPGSGLPRSGLLDALLPAELLHHELLHPLQLLAVLLVQEARSVQPPVPQALLLPAELLRIVLR